MNFTNRQLFVEPAYLNENKNGSLFVILPDHLDFDSTRRTRGNSVVSYFSGVSAPRSRNLNFCFPTLFRPYQVRYILLSCSTWYSTILKNQPPLVQKGSHTYPGHHLSYSARNELPEWLTFTIYLLVYMFRWLAWHQFWYKGNPSPP